MNARIYLFASLRSAFFSQSRNVCLFCTKSKTIPVIKKTASTSHIPIIRDRLLEMDESKLIYLQTCDFKDPTIILIISVFLGSLGIDRFLIGDVALGVGKLVTLGGCGIWMIIDWFLIMDATKKKNLEQLQNILMF